MATVASAARGQLLENVDGGRFDVGAGGSVQVDQLVLMVAQLGWRDEPC